jgi:hypothetical protein
MCPTPLKTIVHNGTLILLLDQTELVSPTPLLRPAGRPNTEGHARSND